MMPVRSYLKVNRALAARVNAYRSDWPGVLKACQNHFMIR